MTVSGGVSFFRSGVCRCFMRINACGFVGLKFSPGANFFDSLFKQRNLTVFLAVCPF